MLIDSAYMSGRHPDIKLHKMRSFLHVHFTKTINKVEYFSIRQFQCVPIKYVT